MSKVFRFSRVPDRLVQIYLEWIMNSERVKPDRDAVSLATNQSRGDLRAAINTLQTLQNTENEKLLASSRDLRYTMKEGLEMVFAANSLEHAYNALRNSEGSPKEKIRAIYSSVVSSDLNEDQLAAILEKISKADELVGKIGRTQEWRLLRYFDRMLAYSLSKTIPKNVVSYSEDNLPWDLKLRLWNEARYIREIGNRISKSFHTSSHETISVFLPYLLLIATQKKGGLEILKRYLALDEAAYRVLTKEANRMASKVKI